MIQLQGFGRATVHAGLPGKPLGATISHPLTLILPLLLRILVGHPYMVANERAQVPQRDELDSGDRKQVIGGNTIRTGIP